MADKYFNRTTGITLSGTGITVRWTHSLIANGVSATPNNVNLQLRGTTGTGGIAIVALTSDYIDVCAVGVGNGLCDIAVEYRHSIIS